MKYIKTYETYEIINLKKYIIIYNEHRNKKIYIWETHKSDKGVYIKFMYVYYLGDKKIDDYYIPNKIYKEETNFQYFTSVQFDLFKNNIIYLSDNLQECLDILPVILNSNKYNL